jgi:hypothetical protein
MKSICAPDGFVGFPGGVESQDPERDRRRPWTIHHRAEQPSAGGAEQAIRTQALLRAVHDLNWPHDTAVPLREMPCT